MTFVDFLGYARKFFIALIAALAVLTTALADGTVSTAEWLSIASAFLGAYGVYAVSNVSPNDASGLQK